MSSTRAYSKYVVNSAAPQRPIRSLLAAVPVGIRRDSRAGRQGRGDPAIHYTRVCCLFGLLLPCYVTFRTAKSSLTPSFAAAPTHVSASSPSCTQSHVMRQPSKKRAEHCDDLHRRTRTGTTPNLQVLPRSLRCWMACYGQWTAALSARS